MVTGSANAVLVDGRIKNPVLVEAPFRLQLEFSTESANIGHPASESKSDRQHSLEKRLSLVSSRTGCAIVAIPTKCERSPMPRNGGKFSNFHLLISAGLGIIQYVGREDEAAFSR